MEVTLDILNQYEVIVEKSLYKKDGVVYQYGYDKDTDKLFLTQLTPTCGGGCAIPNCEEQ
jgi:hypothetical protein